MTGRISSYWSQKPRRHPCLFSFPHPSHPIHLSVLLVLPPPLPRHPLGVTKGHPPPVGFSLFLHHHLPLATTTFLLISTLEPSNQSSLKVTHCVFSGFLLSLEPNPNSLPWPRLCCVIQSLPNVPVSPCAPFPFLSQLCSQRPSLISREARLPPSCLWNLESAYSHFHSLSALSL